jgi:O-antigen ligase
MAVQLLILVILILLAVWSSQHGLQNGILLLLVTGMIPMSESTLIRGFGLPQITMDRIVWPLVLLVFIVQWKQGKIERYPFDWIESCMFLLLTTVILSMYVHGTFISNKWGGAKLHFDEVLTGFALPLMSYFIMRRGASTKVQAKSFLTGVGLITVYLSLTGIGEAWHQSWLVFPKYILDPYKGTHFGFARGPFLNASYNGLAIAMGLPIVLWLFFHRRDGKRWLWVLGMALAGITLPYILQRAVWLGAAVALGLTTLMWPKWRYMLIGVTLLVAALAGLMFPDTLENRIQRRLADAGTLEYRIRVLEATQEIIDDHLFMGVGFYRFPEELRRYGLPTGYSSHNTPLTLFAELGLIGFLLYLSIFGLLLFESMKAYLQRPRSREIIGALWGITAAYLLVSLAADLRGTLYTNVLLFALWGMILEMVRKEAALWQEQEPSYRRVASFV